MLGAAFRLPLRQTEGSMASVITLMELTISAPDHTTVSCRAVTLGVIEPGQLPHDPLHGLFDSTGRGHFNFARRGHSYLGLTPAGRRLQYA